MTASWWEVQLVALVCVLSYLGMGVVKAFVLRQRKETAVAMQPPVSWAGLRLRLDAIARQSPKLAIVEGWSWIEEIVLQRTRELEKLDPVRTSTSDLLAIARQLPGIRACTVDRLASIYRCRNLIVHRADGSLHAADIQAALSNLVGVMQELNPRFDYRWLRAAA